MSSIFNLKLKINLIQTLFIFEFALQENTYIYCY